MSESVLGRWAALGLLLVTSGCGARNAQSAFEADFACKESSVTDTTGLHRYVVSGCGHEVTYLCVGAAEEICALQGTDRGETTSSSEPVSPAPRRAPKVLVESKDDSALMVLELVLDGKALLRITATPDKRSDLVQLKVIRRDTVEGSDECSLDFMVNGQVLAMPKANVSHTKNVVSHRVQVGRELIGEFGAAEKIALRVCRERWGLDGEQVAKVRDFMERFQEEQAWNAVPRKGSTGGMLAPSGGWPEWSVQGTKPSTFEGAGLDAPALFKKLSPSVFKLEASLNQGVAQGSAVAVSTTELVTNCHVVRGAIKLVLKRDREQWPARLVRADPSTDRCVVTGEGLMAQPVAGIRSYDSLQVGEFIRWGRRSASS
jgi:hypothetical protein